MAGIRRPSARRTRRPTWRWVALVLLTLALIIAAAAGVSALLAPRPVEATVVHVVDGDTLDLRTPDGIVRVRLVGIDAPEQAHFGDPEACGADAAAVRLKALVSQGAIAFAPDSTGVAIDRFGRHLGYVSVDGHDVGETLVVEGLVEAWYPADAAAPSRYPLYWALEQRAHLERRGSWATCPRLGR